MLVPIIIDAVIAYLLGSIMSSIILTKKMCGFDVRDKGSGNAGATNTLRTAGVKVALLTLICDVLKGVVAVTIAILIGLIAKVSPTEKAILVEIAGVCVVLGHTFPIFFKFKGGKGVATSLGVLLIFNWKIGLICLVFALLLMAVSKIVSLGSIAAAVLFPVLCIFIRDSYIIGDNTSRLSYIIFGFALAAIVIFNHRSNIQRLAKGEENKLNFHKSK